MKWMSGFDGRCLPSAYICMYQIEGVSGDAAISFSAPSSYPAPSYTTNQPTTFIF